MKNKKSSRDDIFMLCDLFTFVRVRIFLMEPGTEVKICQIKKMSKRDVARNTRFRGFK